MILSTNEMAWCLKEAGFAGGDIVLGVAIGLAESGGNSDVIGKVTTGVLNGNFDHGWMQISNLWHGAKFVVHPDWRDPLVNAILAKEVFDETVRINAKKRNGLPGWSAWSTYGVHEKWMPFATVGAKFPFPPTKPVGSFTPTVTLDPTSIPLDIAVTRRP